MVLLFSNIAFSSEFLIDVWVHHFVCWKETYLLFHRDIVIKHFILSQWSYVNEAENHLEQGIPIHIRVWEALL